jgi:hypothetical protein
MGKIILDIWWLLSPLHHFSYPQSFVDIPVIIFRRFYCMCSSIIREWILIQGARSDVVVCPNVAVW